MKKTLITFLISLLAFLGPASAYAQGIMGEFNPNSIVPDTVFTDTQTFGGADGIQKFLESKNSVLANTGPNFLVKLNEPMNPLLKTALNDPEPGLDQHRTAAQLIWDASQSSGLNPQIILVTLNKEQGLITGAPNNLQRALDHAMGFDCPDQSGCGNLFPGFYYQLFGNVDTEGNRYLGASKSLARSFNTPGGRGPYFNGKQTQVGDVITISNTIGGYDNVSPIQTVTLLNKATAALYRYTPHVFNGNYNFWKFFTDWFKYPNGTLVKLLNDNVLYILQNGVRQELPTFVAKARGINISNSVTISPSEFENYPIGPLFAPLDNTIVTLNNAFYVFLNGIKRPASPFVLSQKKIDTSHAIPMPDTDAALFPNGSPLPPNDGTVISMQHAGAIFIVQNGLLKHFSPFTYRQYVGAKKVMNVNTLPDVEVSSYAANGYVPPLDGTLIQDSSRANVYVMSQGLKEPLTQDLFTNLGFQKKNIVTIGTMTELASFDIGTPPPPSEGTYFSIKGSNEIYLYKNGEKHQVFPFVAQQRHIVPNYSFEASIATNWPNGIVLPPLDGTLVKSESAPTIYLVAQGQLHALTYSIFKNRKYSFKDVVTLSDAQINELPTDGFAPPADNTYFSVIETHDFYLFGNGTRRLISPLVAVQRRMTPDYSFPLLLVSDWPIGAPIVPVDYTLLKSASSPAVYEVLNKELHLLTATAFKRRALSIKNVKIIPQTELDSYPKGDTIQR